MNPEWVGLIISGISIAFGFGRQAAAVNVLRRDVDSIADLHRETIQKLHEINLRLERLEQRLSFLERN